MFLFGTQNCGMSPQQPTSCKKLKFSAKIQWNQRVSEEWPKSPYFWLIKKKRVLPQDSDWRTWSDIYIMLNIILAIELSTSHCDAWWRNNYESIHNRFLNEHQGGEKYAVMSHQVGHNSSKRIGQNLMSHLVGRKKG